ncbi:YdeI/OmpD-associated family protein [Flavobacterium quisquiliarum]|uniref:YdeI family protein n=1 Tax=Flavobacterium quisquiliarum TaxID=1834436 RepID=A0ABV8WET3_9FLAO|nr:DUF1801 domain-containing protein [Flavobacterium quisquiliarum]MBW1657573.1 hypothetical protein [Flavobacterium quisquiliarum]NWL00016.1 hypothetical protein [Flavobacterium collinsii]
MTEYSANPKVDFYFEKAEKWREELELLRSIALDCHLAEELKWGSPCYTFDKANIVLIHAFKEYCAFLFFKGALMKDPNKILIQQSENVQAARQVRFTSVEDIISKKDFLRNYIYEAAEIEKAGLKVELKKVSEFEITEEFQVKLNENPDLKEAFYALTPGRQRAYLLNFSQPKQSKTREARIEKNIPQILAGKGLND